MSGLDRGGGGEKTEVALGGGITFKVGKFGPYVSDGAKNAPAKKYTAETITLEIAKELLGAVGEKALPVNLGKNPKTNAEYCSIRPADTGHIFQATRLTSRSRNSLIWTSPPT